MSNGEQTRKGAEDTSQARRNRPTKEACLFEAALLGCLEGCLLEKGILGGICLVFPSRLLLAFGAWKVHPKDPKYVPVGSKGTTPRTLTPNTLSSIIKGWMQGNQRFELTGILAHGTERNAKFGAILAASVLMENTKKRLLMRSKRELDTSPPLESFPIGPPALLTFLSIYPAGLFRTPDPTSSEASEFDGNDVEPPICPNPLRKPRRMPFALPGNTSPKVPSDSLTALRFLAVPSCEPFPC